jgi:hypothetical protein
MHQDEYFFQIFKNIGQAMRPATQKQGLEPSKLKLT